MQNTEILFPADVYADHLTTINGINFTRREADITACLLSARGTSKIATFLNISPKTVVNHIRNIMLKVDCNSREGIIDFIERSQKISHLRHHYSNLLMKADFEKSLKDIAKLNKNEVLNCRIISRLDTNDPLFSRLGHDLKLAGFIVSIDSEAVDIPGEREIYIPCEGLSKERNYYLFVFEILDKFLPNAKIQKFSSTFKDKDAKAICSPESTYYQKKPEEIKDEPLPLVTENSFSWFKKSTSRSLFVGLGLFAIGILFTYIYNNFGSTQHESQPIRSDIILPSETTIHNVGADENQIRSHENSLKSWNLPRQDNVFVGRKELLENLHNKLHGIDQSEKSYTKRTDTENLSVTNTIAISAFAGLGGIGKTQLALQYIHQNKYPYTFRAWFPAENLDHLRQKYIEFAKIIGYAEKKPTIEGTIAYVKKWLGDHPGWLLVYDNVETYNDIAPFLPEKGGHVILTTRQRHWPSKFQILTIDVMTEEEAISLIKSLSGRDIESKEKEQTKQLVKTLGYLPLALAQAGTYIQQNQISIAEYLESYKNYEQKLLEDNTLPEGTNCLPIATTWNMSLAAIAKESQSKQEHLLFHELLTVCSYLAPEKIPRQTLLAWLKKAQPDLTSPQITLNKIIRHLWQYSMINSDGDNFISVHRLVQAVLRHQHKQKSENPPLSPKWYTTLLETMHDEFNRKTTVLEDENRKKLLLPHFLFLDEHCNQQKWTEPSFFIAQANVLEDIGFVFHYHMGDPSSAKPYYERAISIKSKYYGDDHIEVAKTLNNFGDAYGSLGDPKKQREFLERALKITENHYGKDHQSLVLILESLGAAYWALGETNQGNQILRRGLAIGEAYFGKNGVEIANTLYFLGNTYGDLGNTTEQKKFLERALKINEQHYGKTHAQTAFVIANLGIAYRILGDLKKSQEFLERALLLQEHFFGKDHVEVGETLGNLSNTYLELGDAKKAKKTLERAISILENYYGKDHVYVARTMSYLGDVYTSLHEPEQARKILEHTLAIKEQHYGTQHFSTAKTLTSLGKAYIDLGEFIKASEVLEHALKVKQDYYGKNHIEVAITLLRLIELDVKRNSFKVDGLTVRKCLSIFYDNYGVNHSYTKNASNLLDLYRFK